MERVLQQLRGMATALLQAGYALLFFAGALLLVRLTGKRLAGQSTTFDLLILIQMGVVLQTTFVLPGQGHAAIFIATVLLLHRGLAAACRRSEWLRYFVRGHPTTLVRDGVILDEALRSESMSRDELLAGLRKLGYESPEKVRLAVLEETGHVSAVGNETTGGG